MKANLIQRVALGVGAVISLAGISGCTEEEARWGRVIGISAQVSPSTDYTVKAVGAVIDTASKDTLDTINAEKMGTNVFVSTGRQGNESISVTSRDPNYFPEYFTLENLTDGGIVKINGSAHMPYINKEWSKKENEFDAFQVKRYENNKNFATIIVCPNYHIINDLATGEVTKVKDEERSINCPEVKKFYDKKYPKGYRVRWYGGERLEPYYEIKNPGVIHHLINPVLIPIGKK